MGIDRSTRKGGFVQPFAKKEKENANVQGRNENYGIIYFQASCSRLAATFPTARRYHSKGGDIKTGDQFCVRDVARTWNRSRGKIFNTPLSLSPHLNFRFSLDLFRNLFIFATCHTPRQLLKMKLIWNNIFFDTCFDLTFFSFLFLLVRG